MANEAQMNVTSVGDVSTITKTVWSERLNYEAINKMQWIKLAGPEGSGSQDLGSYSWGARFWASAESAELFISGQGQL